MAFSVFFFIKKNFKATGNTRFLEALIKESNTSSLIESLKP
jgi:hypothetical protein